MVAGLTATSASATDPAVFPGSAYGNVDLKLNESLGGGVMAIRTLGHIFERVGLLPDEDPMRTVAGPVVRLDRLVEYGEDTATSTCTATIVSQTYILTNHHCIPGFETIREASILINYEDPDDAEAVRVNVATTPEAANEELDYAFVRIEGTLPEGITPLALQPAESIPPGSRLVILHHPAGQPKMMTQYDCRAHEDPSSRAHELRHRCDTLPGSSGGLIVNAALEPVGLHHSGGLRPEDPGTFNLATRLSAIVETYNALHGGEAETPVASTPPGTGTQLPSPAPAFEVPAPAAVPPQPTSGESEAPPATGSTDPLNGIINSGDPADTINSIIN
jgi:V8-like Glu-specific endopeptidase